MRTRNPKIFIKLCDFSGSTDKEDKDKKTFCGTKYYFALECVYEGYSNAIDIWSMGVIALELITGLPNEAFFTSPWAWRNRIRRRAKRLATGNDDPLIPLLKRMLEINPQDRLSAQTCVTELFIQIADTPRPIRDDGTEFLNTERPTLLLQPQRQALQELNQPTLFPRKRAQDAVAKTQGDVGIFDEPASWSFCKKRKAESDRKHRAALVRGF